MSKRIVVLISGSGSNLQALIDKVELGEINGEIVGIISDKEDAFGLVRGVEHGIPGFFIPKGDLHSELPKRLEQLKPDLIVLAGFLSILEESIIQRFQNKIMNLHPALIPSFCGPGMYGMKVHEAVLNRGVKVSGVTVHFVDAGVDSGPIILQDTVSVSDGDTPESLANKIHALEHVLLPKAVKLFCEDRLRIKDQRVFITNKLG